MAFDNQHLPVVPPAPIVDEKPEKDEATKKKELDDVRALWLNLAFCSLTYGTKNFNRSFAYQIMESFKKGGFGGAKMFSKDDLENLSAEDIAQKVILQPKTVDDGDIFHR